MQIKIRDNYLPEKIEELAKFVLIGREKLVSVRAEIRAIDKLDLAKDVREQKRDEAQLLAGALLDAEAKIGEITLKISKATTNTKNKKLTAGTISKEYKIKELGFTEKQVSQFQRLAENPEIIEKVKA